MASLGWLAFLDKHPVDEGGRAIFLGAMSMSWNSPDYVGGRSRNDAIFVELALVGPTVTWALDGGHDAPE